MSRTRRRGKSPGYEYRPARPSKGVTTPGRYAKRLTHKRERLAAKRTETRE